MSLTITFNDEETERLLTLWSLLDVQDESGARAEGQIVTMVGEKLGEELAQRNGCEVAA